MTDEADEQRDEQLLHNIVRSALLGAQRPQGEDDQTKPVYAWLYHYDAEFKYMIDHLVQNLLPAQIEGLAVMAETNSKRAHHERVVREMRMSAGLPVPFYRDHPLPTTKIEGLHGRGEIDPR